MTLSADFFTILWYSIKTNNPSNQHFSKSTSWSFEKKRFTINKQHVFFKNLFRWNWPSERQVSRVVSRDLRCKQTSNFTHVYELLVTVSDLFKDSNVEYNIRSYQHTLRDMTTYFGEKTPEISDPIYEAINNL